MPSPARSKLSGYLLHLVLPVLVVLVLIAAYRGLWRQGPVPLVVYTAHDSIYSEKVLRAFESRTGISVLAQFDTEATKSLGLVERLIREKSAPRCDVFWNNELLGTLYLKEKGLLLPYRGTGFQRIPDGYKDPDGYWVGFGARLRVYIINTDKLSPIEQAVQVLLREDLTRVAMAKPLYGTTLTHYTVLWKLWGSQKLKDWHRRWRSQGVREVTGNAHVKNLIASGVCDLGFTDSDDFFVAKDAGSPVAMLPVRLEDGATICIPNTICIIKGTHQLEGAKRLVDYLLSEACEVALANSKSRQIPLGAVDERKLPDEVKELERWAQAGYPLVALADARQECLSWLKSEYLK